MADSGSEAKLWDSDHPYYCEESNFYKNGMNTVFSCWQEFHESLGGTDPDLNLVFRWDWTPYDDEGNRDKTKGVQTLMVFWILQRKGIYMSSTVPVTPDEEPEVRAWLTDRWEKVRELWAPLSGWKTAE